MFVTHRKNFMTQAHRLGNISVHDILHKYEVIL